MTYPPDDIDKWAFPLTGETAGYNGMTLRQWYAGRAIGLRCADSRLAGPPPTPEEEREGAE